MVVLTIVVQVPPPLMENSHLITEPVWPLKVSIAPLAPEQTAAFEATEPPTEPAFTVMIAAEEFAEAQVAF